MLGTVTEWGSGKTSKLLGLLTTGCFLIFDFERFSSRLLLELLDECLEECFEKCFDKFCDECLEECSEEGFDDWRQCFDVWWESKLFNELFEVYGLKRVGSRYC